MTRFGTVIPAATGRPTLELVEFECPLALEAPNNFAEGQLTLGKSVGPRRRCRVSRLPNHLMMATVRSTALPAPDVTVIETG
jgi:hypothetical protein